jgi:hypothetical protein
MDRSNIYENVFELYLRSMRLGYIAVDESKRAQFGVNAIKSLDFIVVGPSNAKFVVDVKGRRFPCGRSERPKLTWQNWATREDVEGLIRWSRYMGSDFRPVLVFVYHLISPYQVSSGEEDVYCYRDKQYLIRGIDCGVYRDHMKLRSARWDTVYLSASIFRHHVQPFSRFFTDSHESNCHPSLGVQ